MLTKSMIAIIGIIFKLTRKRWHLFNVKGPFYPKWRSGSWRLDSNTLVSKQERGEVIPLKNPSHTPDLVPHFGGTFFQTIIWSLAFWWTHKFLNFGQICACGHCLKRVTVKVFWLILPHPLSNSHNLGLEWTFWTFSVLKMIVLSLAIWWAQKYFDFGLICACGGCSNRVTVRADFAIFWGGYFS